MAGNTCDGPIIGTNFVLVFSINEIVMHAEECHSTSEILHTTISREEKCCTVHNCTLFVQGFRQVSVS